MVSGGTGAGWLAAWHGFGWLADLISAGAEAREAARALIHSWLSDSAAWHRSAGGPMSLAPGSSPGSSTSTRSPAARPIGRCAERCWRARGQLVT